MAYLKNKLINYNLQVSKALLVLTIFILLGVLEYFTPTEYVFGYLYSGAILLVSYWFGGIATTSATFIAVYLTMLNRPLAKLFLWYDREF